MSTPPTYKSFFSHLCLLSFIFLPHLTLPFHQVAYSYKLIASQSFVFNLILVFSCTSALIQSIRYLPLAVELTMAPRKELRAKTQVPDTLENKSSPESSLSRLLSSSDYSPSPAPFCRLPPPSSSCPPPQTPLLQDYNSANSASATINLGLIMPKKLACSK